MNEFLSDTLLILIRILTIFFYIPAIAFGLIAFIAIVLIIAAVALVISPLYLLYKLESYI